MTKQGYVILNGYVLDVTTYLNTVTNIIPLSSTLSSRSFAVNRMFLPLDLTLFLYINLGKDITEYFDGNITTDNPDLYKRCLIHLFQKGVVPSYIGSGCSRINPALWASMGAGLMYFLIKMNLAYLSRVGFIQRLLFSSAPPELSALSSRQQWPYTILMVPCFAESSDTLKQTLDTLSRSTYDDNRKLLMFVCDGITTSTKEQKETHTFLLESLGYSSSDEPIAQPYTSLGQGKKRINYGRVYSGYYETGRNRVPYLVIVKLGHPSHHYEEEEESRGDREAPTGNRGKRDSLVLVFGFLERCMNLANNRITPLDYEIFNQCYNVLGIDPRLFKYLLVTDADIQVQSDVVQKLVSRLEGDRHMLAVSGHVRPANPEDNLTTMLQIFPVYMAFFSGLAYEACLRSVMTIQGGLVMYKIWTENVSLDEKKNEKYFKKWKMLQQSDGSKATSQQSMHHQQQQQQYKWPKTSDEIMISNPFQDYNSRRSSRSSDTSMSTMPSVARNKERPESRLSLSARIDIRPCCVHPTVLRGIATPQANTMHMQNLLLLGEEKIMPIVLLRSHPGHRLGFEPEAVGYATLPTNFFALQGYATRNLRAAFHTQLEMQRVSWQLGFTYWVLSTTEILDMIFSMPIIVYLYGVFGRTAAQYGMAYLIITCSFTGLVVLHILFFLLRRQFRYIFWFVLYCLFSVPLFAIWFPLLAVWQSDDANLWYDVWPIKKKKQLGRYYTPASRLHGILDTTVSSKSKVVEKGDEEEEEVPRMRFGEFEVIEAKRLHQAAEAALDSNFTGFTATAGFIDPSSLQQQQEAALSPPLAAQVREGLHSTRIITNYQQPLGNEMTWRPHRYVSPDSPVYYTNNPFADQPQQYENPFDDPHDTRRQPSEEPFNKSRKNSQFQRHRQSHSQSSYFTYASRNSYPVQQNSSSTPSTTTKEIGGGSTTLPSSLNSSGFAKIPKGVEEKDGSMMMMELIETPPPLVVEQDDPLKDNDPSSYNNDRASTTLSIKSNTFSLLAMDSSHHGTINEEGEEEEIESTVRLPRHQRLLDNNNNTQYQTSSSPRHHQLDEGRSVALHKFNPHQNNNQPYPLQQIRSNTSVPIYDSMIPQQPRHRFLNNKATSNSLSRHFRNMSQPSLRTQPSKVNLNDNLTQAEVQQAIKLEIRSFLMRADLESTTRAQVKQHLKEVFGAAKINESDVQLMQFVTDCIEEITFEFLS